MPIKLRSSVKRSITVEDYVEYVEQHVDLADPDSIIESADMLKALSNNRTFIADQITRELKDCTSLQENNKYSPQVLMIANGKNFFVRANFWPSLDDAIVKSNGPESFFYNRAHDHNFDFLTIGHYGPGYDSDFYEYDHTNVIGYPGEKVDIKFKGRDSLAKDEIIFYRKSFDIHSQLPPESFSMSLNLMTDFQTTIFKTNQYFFDINNSSIIGLANRASGPLIIDVAAEVGDENTLDVLFEILNSNKQTSRVRVQTMASLCKVFPEKEASILQHISLSEDTILANNAKVRIERLSKC
ncbi:hypothetical protein [Alteromonas gilva]|uniref:Transposase n=1 Tax=Alteromonas gilva TaxID=2987522 RepID=A0ABT5L749_9ALTE|nr:hypothetical protein [Alteromonas gilva]MDC8832895.1 hypothetical protein [Alteromonas gilva]